MTEINEAEARLYNYTTELFKGHEKLLGDSHRNRAFYKALKKHVTPESNVLDIGSGTGIWAIVAAQLGAKRVVAVEQDPVLIGLIKSLAIANGVSDRIEAIASESTQLQHDREFDIIISETIGNLAFDEQIVPIMIDARNRLLKPGGVLIPESVALVASPAHFKSREKKFPAGIDLNYDIFKLLALNIPVGLNDLSRLKILSQPRDLVRADLTTIDAIPGFSDLTLQWELDDVSEINCFAVWSEATLTRGVNLTTVKTTSWTPLIYRFAPFSIGRGLIEFTLTITAVTNYWKATLSSERGQQSQTYSPAYAASLLLAQSRTESDLLGSPQRLSFIDAGRVQM